VKPKPINPQQRSTFWSLVCLTVVLAAGGVVLVLQWRDMATLRIERDFAQDELRQLERLRVENSRLRERSLASAELERLRADHAALPRLRQELDQLARQTAPAP